MARPLGGIRIRRRPDGGVEVLIHQALEALHGERVGGEEDEDGEVGEAEGGKALEGTPLLGRVIGPQSTDRAESSFRWAEENSPSPSRSIPFAGSPQHR